jgi:hypothetical protein
MYYAYDNLGNITQKHTTADDSFYDPDTEYYNKWFGVASYTGTGGPHAMSSADGSNGNSLQMQYDANGNIVTFKVGDKKEEELFNFINDNTGKNGHEK